MLDGISLLAHMPCSTFWILTHKTCRVPVSSLLVGYKSLSDSRAIFV